jgi:hypothetical protein
MADQEITKKEDGKSAPQSRADLIKEDAGRLLKDDLIGVSDWKRSKISALTGFGIASRAASTIGRSAADSSARLNSLLGSLTQGEDIRELEDGGTDRERFEASMELHGKTEKDLQISLRNSFWSTWLYTVLMAGYLVFLAVSLYFWPAGNWVSVISRLGPFPLIVALWFKHSYMNWIIRERRLGSAAAYLVSVDFLPRK